ncbi:MAG: GntR family transcriptional regulator [Casimicrobiaceae bacterium]
MDGKSPAAVDVSPARPRMRKAAPIAPTVSLVERAYATMRRQILDNAWPPGFGALEHELAESLGMSRTPVREALIRLAREGLVSVVPRHGMRVLPVSVEDMRDIYDVLTALESMAAELVVRRKPSAADLKPLVDASRDMARALKADDLDGWAAADERFHRLLIKLSGNRLLIDAVLNCWDRAHRARMVTLRMRPKPSHSTREHLDVLEKIKSGDARGAFEAHRVHRERGSRELIAILERYRLQNL